MTTVTDYKAANVYTLPESWWKYMQTYQQQLQEGILDNIITSDKYVKCIGVQLKASETTRRFSGAHTDLLIFVLTGEINLCTSNTAARFVQGDVAMIPSQLSCVLQNKQTKPAVLLLVYVKPLGKFFPDTEESVPQAYNSYYYSSN